MALFDKVKSAKTEKTEDRLSGGFKIYPSAIYDAILKRMYAITSDKGSIGVTLELDLYTDPDSDKTERMTKTIYVTNSNGENFYEKDGKNYLSNNWLMADAIAVFATNGEAGLSELETEDVFIKRTVDGKEMSITAEGYPEVAGLELKVAVLQVSKPKQKQVDGNWADTDEIVETNEIDRIFDADGFTLIEWEAEKEAPEFINKWEKTWQGKVKTIKPKVKQTTRTGGAGRSAAAARTTRGGTGNATGRQSRFTRK